MMKSLEAIREQFTLPSVEYRSLPFWAWNDSLDKDELVRQAEQMKEQGMGGFFIHSREGLETRYMGAEWMEAVRTTVQAAEQLGMQTWLYDEDRWPSGFAGGLVQQRGGDAFRAKGLTLEVCRPDDSSVPADAVVLFKAVLDERELLCCERIPDGSKWELSGDEVLLVFRVEISKRSDWFNKEAPPDQLNPDTVRAFIDITYEAYKKEVGDNFGKTIRGVFTDEPSIHDSHCKFTEGRGWIPWSGSFSSFFKERRGYELLDVVPYLFFNGELSSPTRHDYWRTVTERFSESFSKQIGQWCEDHGLAFTGHYLWENNLGTATRVCGAVMPNYRYQHVPGIDMLKEQTNEYITVKQCSSVANQYGRTFVLSETYGCTGWAFTFEGQKWMGDFQYVLGVNLRSQHLALYSIKGCRKRDYPPVFNYNTSWWKYNYVTENYFARLSAVLSQGRPVRDVLVLHPSSTAWTRLGTGPYGFPARGKDRDVSALNHYGHEFNAFLGKLLREHYDLDLGDETIMAETGAVKGNTLAVNLAAYRVVVIPAIQSMLKSTFRLLLEFVGGGGRVIAVGPQPTMLEGRLEKRLDELYTHKNVAVVQDGEAAVEALEGILKRRVSIQYVQNSQGKEADELLYMLQDIGDRDNSRVLFVVNNDRNGSHQVSIKMEGTGVLEQWDALTGSTQRLNAVSSGGFIRFEDDFGPAESKLYLLTAGRQPEGAPDGDQAPAVEVRPSKVVTLGQECRFRRTQPNVLVLDRCSYRLGDSGWSKEMDVWQAQRDVREALGMRQIYSNGQEQRYQWILEPHPGDGEPVEWKFAFQVGQPPSGGLHLVVESAEDYDIQLNGERIANRPDGWFLDRAFDNVPLTGVKKGWNELVLSCRYLNRMEVEDCYLTGDFSVDSERKLAAEPHSLKFGDWCLQGYPHYCGSMVYSFDAEGPQEAGRQVVLELGEHSAVTVEIQVNGRSAGHIPWRAANRVDVTQFMHGGMNLIEIEAMGSPRNMLGPFHQAAGDTSVTNWASFRREGKDYTPEYKLHPYGLFGSVTLAYY